MQSQFSTTEMKCRLGRIKGKKKLPFDKRQKKPNFQLYNETELNL